MNDAAARESLEPTLKALEEAWKRGDAESWSANCTPDVDFINLLGMYVKGRAAVTNMHDKIYRGPYAGSTLRFTLEHMRVLSDGSVLAIVPGELHIPAGPVKGTLRTVATMLFVQWEGGWLVASFQNTKREATAADHTATMLDVFTE